MDDIHISSLHESRNEWVARLVTVLTPNIFTGLQTIFQDALKLSVSQNQKEKYLMTFQNLLLQVPKWNNDIIQTEVSRIITVSQCNYIEDLITCVHIIQLKALTCVRVGANEKNVDINIPSLNDFVHKVYINVARVIYTNIYLFEHDILPLQLQQNYRKVDAIIKESIIDAVRSSMPIDELLRAYLEDTVETKVENSLKEPTQTNTISTDPPDISRDEVHTVVDTPNLSPDVHVVAPPEITNHDFQSVDFANKTIEPDIQVTSNDLFTDSKENTNTTPKPNVTFSHDTPILDDDDDGRLTILDDGDISPLESSLGVEILN
tara:strand:+ start:927 stop:1886 length:960 start_codon:yes stop_codon:yes gene_type:complete